MSTAHLRRRLDAWSFPTTSFVSEIVATTRQARATEQRLSSLETRVPRPYELDVLVREVRRHWSQTGAVTGLPRKTLRRLPWILFYPSDKPRSWLGRDPQFRNQLFRWLDSKGPPSSLAALVRVLLRQYPVELADFDKWLERTAVSLEKNSSVRLARWRYRQGRYRVLGRRGPRVLAGAWMAEDWDVSAFLEDTGLQEVGTDAGLRRETVREVIDALSSGLSKAQLAPDALDRRLLFLLNEHGQVVSDELKPVVAHGLLAPFLDGDPPEEVRSVVRRFLLQVVGDPRILPGSWNPVSAEAKGVMLRWLVAETLDDFFRLLDRTALDRHWRQRKAFWNVYLDMKVITDAWLVLGQHARRQGRKILGAAGGTWGQLGGGGDNSQSVLLMRLGGLTIAEWSHNGSCRIWLDGAPSAPPLYQRIYRRTQLASTSSEEAVRHDAHGRWKDTIARIVYRQTGIVWRSQ